MKQSLFIVRSLHPHAGSDLVCNSCGSREPFTQDGRAASVAFLAAVAAAFDAQHRGCSAEEVLDATPPIAAGAEAWARSGDYGASSATIWAVLMGRPFWCGPPAGDTPWDPADFGRCHRLLQAEPAWRARLHEVAARFPAWAPLVAHWDELTALYELESPTGTALRLYERMRELREGRRSPS